LLQQGCWDAVHVSCGVTGQTADKLIQPAKKMAQGISNMKAKSCRMVQ
jgi:hypothetical protein